MPADRSIVVFGAGGVGCYLGGRLAAIGVDVTLVGRARLVQAIEQRGLVLEDGDETAVSRPAGVVSAEGLPPADLVILTVKTYDVTASVPVLRSLLGERGLVLAVQNGAGSEEVLADALGRDRVLPGTLTVSVSMEEPGVVSSAGRGGMALSTMTGGPVPAWIVDLFARSGLVTVEVGDGRSLRWSKLLLNLIGAATCAILDIDMNALVADPRLFRLEQRAFREAGRVVDAMDVRTVALPRYPVPLARMVMRLPGPLARRLLGERLAASRGGRAPAMRGDVARGRTEVAYLNGAVVDWGRRLGVRTPVNEALTDLVEQVTIDPERRAYFRGRPDRLLAQM